MNISRSIYNRKIAGICGLIGNKLNIDSNLIRIIFLILLPYAKILILIYIICFFIIPNESEK